MLRITDIGEVVYGGAVTAGEWWDSKRIKDGTLVDKDVYKKAGFWVYLGLGVPALLISAFGWWRRYEPWTEKLATGFLYDLPRFTKMTVKSLSATTATGADESNALRQAREILAAKMRTNQDVRMLNRGGGQQTTDFAMSDKSTIMV